MERRRVSRAHTPGPRSAKHLPPALGVVQPSARNYPTRIPAADRAIALAPANPTIVFGEGDDSRWLAAISTAPAQWSGRRSYRLIQETLLPFHA
jgi:hypothetical protein